MSGRITSGSKNLDLIFGGGIPSDSILLLSGPPGSGKTMLAHQIFLANIGEKARAVYLTTLGEPVQKILKNIQAFDFFDPSIAMRSIFYDDAGEILAREGLKKFLDFVFYSLRQFTPKFFCIDGIHRIRSLSESEAEYERFLYELTGLFSSYQCTTFWLGIFAEGDLPTAREANVCDHVVILSHDQAGNRTLRIAKLARSHFIPGEHSYTLSEGGFRIYPRFTPTLRSRKPQAREAMTWGGPPFDEILGKNLWKGGLLLIKGGSGSGKTTAGLHFLAGGTQQAQPGILVSFKEDLADLCVLSESFGWDLKGGVERGEIGFLFQPPAEVNLDDLALRIAQMIREMKAERIFLNDIHYLFKFLEPREPSRLFEYTYLLFRYLRVTNVATLFSFGQGPQEGVVEELCDHALLTSVLEEGNDRFFHIQLIKGNAALLGPRQVVIKALAPVPTPTHNSA